MIHKIEEFIRGSVIEYQQQNQLKAGYLKYYQDIVWGTDSDEDGRDIVSIGKFGCNGILYMNEIIGVDITEKLLIDYGFLNVTGNKTDCITYYRDDFGHVKLDTYGIEHLYMKGKPLRYLHDFQRVFFDYKGYILYPKISDMPRKEFESKLVITKKHTADEMLTVIKGLEKISSEPSVKVDFTLKF